MSDIEKVRQTLLLFAAIQRLLQCAEKTGVVADHIDSNRSANDSNEVLR